MPVFRRAEDQFIDQITRIIEDNIEREQFGVSELAREIGMSRSTLLRKVTKATGQSVSQFIRQVRLERAAELLTDGNFTVSEISYKVGFGSPSYFVKCFREFYGYPPGSMDQQQPEETSEEGKTVRRRLKVPVLVYTLIATGVIVAALLYFLNPGSKPQKEVKSIAVLPFINDSADTTNVYIINGLMESTLNKLQNIQDLRVISRTSVEKFRSQPKTSPEIARELQVSYLVEGSGQKIGNQIRLNIQLIDASNDAHIWSRQYEREAGDIFALQNEIASDIVKGIQVIITPEEKVRIEELPTENLKAYDNFLQGLEFLRHQAESKDNLLKAIPKFKAAIELDPEFSRSYSALSMSYYFLEENKTVKLFADSINYLADQALLHGPDLPQSMIAKALYYMARREYEQAVPYFEKALQLNPNYDLVYVFLIDLYANYLPDTKKYLEYALRGLQIDVSGFDSTTISFNYLHISNAFIQAGFVDQALFYVNRSLDYFSDNLYAEYVKAYILYAKNGDLSETAKLLAAAVQKEPNRLDIIQEQAKIAYYQKDFVAADRLYQKYLGLKNAFGLAIYQQEDAKIAYTCEQLGKSTEARKFLNDFKKYAEADLSIYKNLNLCMYYAVSHRANEALEQLQLFAERRGFHYWTILFIPLDPALAEMRSLPGYKKTFRQLQENFNAFHHEIEKTLRKKGLLEIRR